MIGATGARGVALLLGLILLAALSLLALAAANGMVLQHRMAGNFDEQGRALANATLAQAAARAWLESRRDSEREAGCLASCVLPVAVHGPGELPPDTEFESAAWWRLNGVLAGLDPGTLETYDSPGDGAEPARWLIEELRYEPLAGEPGEAGEVTAGAVGYYRILGRGSGARAGTVAVTESIVAHPWEGSYAPAPYPPATPAGAFCEQFDGDLPCGRLAWRQRR